MIDMLDRLDAGTDDAAIERILEKHALPTPEVQAALDELIAARAELARSLDSFGDASRSALDIPAKVRRNPVKTAALVGGTGFLLMGGPKRVVRAMGRRVFGRRPDPHDGLLPAEIEQVLKDAGLAKDPEVRRALDKDFADYLRQKGRYQRELTPQASFWRTFDRVAAPLGTAGARILVTRLMEAEQDREARRRSRRTSVQGAGPGPTDSVAEDLD